MTGIPDRIKILKLAASLLPSDPQATIRSRIADALGIAALLEDGLLAGQSLDALSSTLVPLLSRKPADGTLSLLSTPVDRLSDLGQQVEHGILVRRDGVRKGVEQAGDEALAGKFPVGVGRHDESSPVSGVEADRLEDAGDGVMSSPGIAAGPDDFDAALAQRHGERLEIVTGQSGVSGYRLMPDEQNAGTPTYYGCCDISLDWTPDGTSALRLSLDCGQAYLSGFWVRMAGSPCAYAHFSFLGSIKGQMLFSADGWHLGRDLPPSQSGPLLKLRGPFPRGMQDGL